MSESDLKYLLALDLRVIPFEMFSLFLMFTGFYFAGGNTSTIAIQALTIGKWAGVFWIGVVGIGLVLPVIIAVTSLHGHNYKLRTVLFNSIIALAGVVLLRFYILYAGQIFSKLKRELRSFCARRQVFTALSPPYFPILMMNMPFKNVAIRFLIVYNMIKI